MVNGKAEFVGSDETSIRAAMAEQLATKSAATLTLMASLGNGKLNVQYQTTQAAKDSHILIALVQKTAQTKVEGGENAGYTLSHVQIVRNLENEPLRTSGNGVIDIVLPPGFTSQAWEVIGLVQNQDNGEILAAAKAQLTDSAK